MLGSEMVMTCPITDLLDDDLFAGADKTRALLAYTVQCGVKLLRCLDAVCKVTADVHGDDTLAIDDST